MENVLERGVDIGLPKVRMQCRDRQRGRSRTRLTGRVIRARGGGGEGGNRVKINGVIHAERYEWISARRLNAIGIEWEESKWGTRKIDNARTLLTSIV